MTRDAKMLCGILLITVPSIQYGGVFLLSLLSKKTAGYMDNPLRQDLFRAGHAHAGVLVLLSLVCQIVADSAALSPFWLWVGRLGAPVAAVLMPMGFFFSVLSPRAERPGAAINLTYLGAVCLAIGVLTLGVGLLRSAMA